MVETGTPDVQRDPVVAALVDQCRASASLKEALDTANRSISELHESLGRIQSTLDSRGSTFETWRDLHQECATKMSGQLSRLEKAVAVLAAENKASSGWVGKLIQSKWLGLFAVILALIPFLLVLALLVEKGVTVGQLGEFLKGLF